jgi:hypothetical protein
MYYIEYWNLEFAGVILRKYLLPFPYVDDAVKWADDHCGQNEGYYLRFKNTQND